MFKRIIIIALVLVIAIACAACGSTTMCVSEEGHPTIVGKEHMEAVSALDERWENGEIESPYEIQMACAEDYWVVFMDGRDSMEDYAALGLYDHYPTAEEIETLWRNRMLEDDLYAMIEDSGF